MGITLGCMQPLLAGGVFQLGMLYGGPVEVVRRGKRDSAFHCFTLALRRAFTSLTVPRMSTPTQVWGFIFCFFFGTAADCASSVHTPSYPRAARLHSRSVHGRFYG